MLISVSAANVMYNGHGKGVSIMFLWILHRRFNAARGVLLYVMYVYSAGSFYNK